MASAGFVGISRGIQPTKLVGVRFGQSVLALVQDASEPYAFRGASSWRTGHCIEPWRDRRGGLRCGGSEWVFALDATYASADGSRTASSPIRVPSFRRHNARPRFDVAGVGCRGAETEIVGASGGLPIFTRWCSVTGRQ